MDPARIHQAEELFHRLVEMPLDERTPCLDEWCGSDASLRSLVLQLLANDDGAMGEFLRTPVINRSLPPAQMLDAMPVRVGRYTLVRRIGEGGMGAVFEATQDRPHRTVALKLIKPGYATHQVLRRFQHEAEILGQLQHPGIACIHDAGMAEVQYAGGATLQQPYFAMELIRGQSLIAFADERRLHSRQRLELLATICDAVHHAHQKGVIHRDLKPANILVTHEGTPKILDFGVARFTDSDLQSITMQVGIGQLIGTIQYMSPEQASGNRSELDTRSDIYSLGVILQELLTGKLPHDLQDRSIPEAARIIRDEEPTRLSSVNADFRGDLETITSKALEKDKNRRYQSATELGADIRRYLNDEPIAARPATTLYQFRKFARRNRGMVVAGAAAVFILVAGVIASSALAVGQHRALQESERQRRIAEAVNEFLNEDLLASADPTKEPDRSVSVREILDRSSAHIEGRFSDAPRVEAAIRKTLSNTYKALGEFSEARVHAARALDIYRLTGAPDDRDAIDAANKLAVIERNLGREGDAEKLFRESLAVAETRYGNEDETTLSIMNNLALLLERKRQLAEAAELLKHVVEVRGRLLGEEHERYRTSLNNLALVYASMGRYKEAEPLHLKELELSRRIDGPEHPDTLLSLNNLAVLYANRDEYKKAEPLMREVLEIRSRVLGPDHPATLDSMDSLGGVLMGLRRFDEAESILKAALAKTEVVHGLENPETLDARDRMVEMYVRSERWDEAEPLNQVSLETRRRVQGEDHYKLGIAWVVRGRIDVAKNRLEEALEHSKRGHAILEPKLGAGDTNVRQAVASLCDIAKRLDRPEEVRAWCDRTGD